MRIIEVGEVKTAKDKRRFFTVGLRAGLGQRVVYRNFWTQFKTTKDGQRTDEQFWDRLTPEEAATALKEKTLIEGEKATRNVEAYEVNGKMVNTYSTVVFPDETVESVFKQQRKVIIDENGEALYTLPESNPVIAKAEDESINVGETKEKELVGE